MYGYCKNIAPYCQFSLAPWWNWSNWRRASTPALFWLKMGKQERKQYGHLGCPDKNHSFWLIDWLISKSIIYTVKVPWYFYCVNGVGGGERLQRFLIFWQAVTNSSFSTPFLSFHPLFIKRLWHNIVSSIFYNYSTNFEQPCSTYDYKAESDCLKLTYSSWFCT